MAGEFRHKDAVSGRVREDEYEHIRQHELNDQAIGDLVYAPSATQLGRLAIGATDTIFSVQGGIPTWRTPADILTDLSGQAGAAFSWNSKKLTSVADPVSAQDAATKNYVDTTAVLDALFDAHTVLYAVSDNTPLALTVGEQTVVGRLAGGNISAVAIGIADNNIVQIDSASVASGEYAKFTVNGLESKSFTEVAADLETAMEAAIDTLPNLTSIQGQTFTLAGAFITSGAYSLTLTQTGATNVTLPTTGTLATQAYANSAVSTHAALTATHGVSGDIVGTTDTQELTNKTLDASVAKGTWTLSGTWSIPAVTLNGTVTLNGQIFDAESGSLQINTTAGGRGLDLISSSSSDTGVRMVLKHNSPSPAVADVVGYFSWEGNDHLSNAQIYGDFSCRIVNKTDGSEEAKYIWALANAPSRNESMTLSAAGALWMDLSVETIGLFLREAANAAADVAGQGQFWVKNDDPNTPYFTDDTGIDRQLVTADYAGLTVDLSATETTINLVDSYEQVTIFDTDMPEKISNGAHATDNIVIGATGDYKVEFNLAATPAGTNKTFEFNAFEIAASGSAITGITGATPGVVTATTHGFSTNDRVKITGVSGMTELNGRIFKITKLTDDTFSLKDEENVDIATGGFGGYTSGGVATLATKLIAVQAHRKFAAQDLGVLDGGGLVSLTKDNTIELWVKCTTDNTNITVEHGSFYLTRLS